MNEQAMRPWKVQEFFAWQENQEARYELVGGFPLKMATDASNRHDDIVVNIVAAIAQRLRGSRYRAFTGRGSVETFPGQIRRPDIGIDCGPRIPTNYKAGNPVVIFEVLSRSTRNFDRFRKIEEYKSLPSLQHIVFVEPDRPRIVAWSRRDEADAWLETTLDGVAATLLLPAVGIDLPLGEIYDGIDFADGPEG